MLNNARDIALGSFLLTVASSYILIGALGVGLHFVMQAGPLVNPINLLIPTDASLAILLTGTALLALLNGWGLARVTAGMVMVILALYSVAHNVLAGAGDQGMSWLTGDLRLDPLSALMVALTGGTLTLGAVTLIRRGMLLAMGLLTLLAGVLTIFEASTADQRLPAMVFSLASLVAGLLMLISGVTLVVVAIARGCSPARLGRLPVLAAVGGVAFSCAAWLLLVNHQQQSLYQRAEYLLDNIQFSAEQTMRSHLLLMRRMAERVAAAEGELERAVLMRDIDNYLTDIPSLRAIALLDESRKWVWRVGREQRDARWLDEQLARTAVRRWLEIPYREPRLLLPQLDQPGRALLAVRIRSGDRALLAGVDVPVLLEQELRLQLGVFQTRVSWHNQHILHLSPSDVEAYEAPDSQRVAGRHIGLPGGLTLDLGIYPAHPHVWEREILVPAVVGGGGLMMTWLLSFSLAMVGLAVGRTRQLVLARDQLASQQVIQDMIVRERPLAEILEAICRMLEEQMPGLPCSIMLADRSGRKLELAAGPSLPEQYRQAIRFIDIGPEMGACGSAAFSREVVVCEEIATDPRWKPFREEALKAGLHACWSRPVLAPNGDVLGTFCVYRLTPGWPGEPELALSAKAMALTAMAVERYRTSRSLRTLESSVEASINGVIIADAIQPDYPIIYCNPAFLAMTGYSREEVMGRNCRFLQGTDTELSAVDTIRRHLHEQREVHVTLRNYRKDGTPFWNDLYIAPVRDCSGNVTHFVGLQNDISARMDYEEHLSYNASHDLLTGLPNRTMLEDRLAHDFALARRHDYRIAVLFVDMDDFKPVNDTLGHSLGDKVLVEVAARLKNGVRAGDTVARLGGDEFIVLLPDVESEHGALLKAGKLLALLSAPYQVPGHELYLTASIGIAISDSETDDPEELIRQADMAMYKAKSKGHNNSQFFTRDITLAISDRVAMRADLQEALAGGQFELHYQPVLDAEGNLHGVEALLRWRHPERGYVAPDEFIPLAESTGQIIPISDWVLDQACRDMCGLSQRGFGSIKVAVNLSPVQFHRSNFFVNLRHVLKNTGLPAAQLELELTERILMDDSEGAIDTLHSLKGLGVDVSIDDFGTGFSSLAYLRALPISKVKIDRSFVKNVTVSSSDAAIIRGVLSMTHHMDHRVVAEGVETREQWQYLVGLGCDLFQGYLLARPMPLSDLEDFIETRRPQP